MLLVEYCSVWRANVHRSTMWTCTHFISCSGSRSLWSTTTSRLRWGFKFIVANIWSSTSCMEIGWCTSWGRWLTNSRRMHGSSTRTWMNCVSHWTTSRPDTWPFKWRLVILSYVPPCWRRHSYQLKWCSSLNSRGNCWVRMVSSRTWMISLKRSTWMSYCWNTYPPGTGIRKFIDICRSQRCGRYLILQACMA